MIKTNKLKLSLRSAIAIVFSIICCSGFSFIMPYRIALIGLLAILLLINNISNNRITLYKSKEFYMIITFVLVIIIGLFTSIDKIETLKFLCVYLVFLEMILLNLNDEFQISFFETILRINKIVSISIIVNVLIPTLFTNYLYFLISGGASSVSRLSGEISSGIYSGIVGEKGEAAFLMVVGIIQILSRFVSDKKIKKENMVWLIVFFIALLLPAKRMLFAIGVLMVFVYIMFWTKGKKKIYICAGFLILGIVAFCVIINISSLNTLLMRFLLYSDDDTGNGRVYLWEIAKQMFSEKPWFGYGYGTYNQYASEVGVILSADRTWESQAHNIYYQLLAEVGSIGFFSFLLIAVTSLINFVKVYLIRARLSDKDLMLLFFGGNLQLMVLIYGYSGNIIYYTNQIFFYFLAIAITIYLRKKYLTREKLGVKTDEK